MIKDNYIQGQEAIDSLIRGIQKVVSIIGATMGTSGSNVVIEAIQSPGHLITNDGETILKALRFADPYEEMARKILLEAVARANKLSGDGSSTTCVLTGAILIEGLKHLKEYSVMDIKKSLEDCIPLIEESLEKQSKKITEKKVGAIASISAEDENIGAMIQEIYEKIGKDGIIYWDISKTTKDTYTIGKGITIEGATYLSPFMCDASESGENTNQIRLKNPHILLTKQKISTSYDFNYIAEYLNSHEIKDLVIFCDEIDPLVIPDFIRTRMERGFRFVVIKMPVLWKDIWFEDLAKVSGAKIVDNTAGLTMKDVRIEHLGKVENIVVTKFDTMIDGIKDISEHLEALKEDDSDEAKLRLARLNTKTARYFVGAMSDSALSYRRLKVEDSISASYQALHGGVVAGGGVALCNVALPDSIGGKILREALKSPYKQIIKNVGGEPEGWGTHPTKEIGQWGLDTRSRKWVNMFKANIIDPKNVVMNACKNAISVSASILTANAVVTFPRVSQETIDNNVIPR